MSQRNILWTFPGPAGASKIMLPKDYINYMLTGVHCTDYSDAGGMLLLDVAGKCWNSYMLQVCGVTKEQIRTLILLKLMMQNIASGNSFTPP